MSKKFLIRIFVCLCLMCAFFGTEKSFAQIYIENPYNEASNGYLLVGKTYQLVCDNVNDKITDCFSEDTSILTVTSNGKITTLKTGEVYVKVTAKINGKERNLTKEFHVIKRSESIKHKYYKLYVSGGYNNLPVMEVTTKPADNTDQITFVNDPDSSTSPVYAARHSGNVVINSNKGNGSTVVTARASYRYSDTADVDAELKTDTAYLAVHTHGWTVPYVKIDTVYHAKRCSDAATCPVTDPTQIPGYGPHRYSSNGTCRDCGFKDTSGHTHVWADKYSTDGDNHWYDCTVSGCDGKKDICPHNFGSDNKCKSCKVKHIHNNWTDKISAHDLGHWTACLDCDARKDYTPHSSVYEGTCADAATCDYCAMPYKYGTHPTDSLRVSSNGYSHGIWCGACKISVSSEPHEYVNDTDTTCRCTICDFVHTHTWGAWTIDKDGHSRKCTQQQRNQRGVVYAIENEASDHIYNADRICTVCGYDGNIIQLEDGTYEIYTPKGFVRFAEIVNGGETTANAVLQNNISLASVTAAPVGTTQNPYGGTFDGQGYTVTIKIADAQSNNGLFGVANGAKIKNFTVDGSIAINTSSKAEHVGAVVGAAKGNAVISDILSTVKITGSATANHVGGIAGSSQVFDGTLLIERCIFTGSVNLPNTGDCVGGILGYANKYVTIKNCGATGAVYGPADSHIGGILGYVNSGYFGGVESCWYSGKTNGGAIIGRIKQKGGDIKNNVCTTGAKAFIGDAASNYTAKAVSDWNSGEAVWALNGGVCDGTQIWYQDLDKSGSYPSFSGKTVYRTGQNTYANTMPSAAVFAENGTVEVKYVKGKCVLAVAAYNGSSLAEAKTKDISSPVSIKLSDILSGTVKYDRVKIMLLKDLDEIEPLCEYSEVK